MRGFRGEIQSETYKISYYRPLTATTEASFDSNTKFYLCAGQDGASPKACTVSEFILGYRFYGNNTFPFAHLGGTDRIIRKSSCL